MSVHDAVQDRIEALALEQEAVAERQINRVALWLLPAFASLVAVNLVLTGFDAWTSFNGVGNIVGFLTIALYHLGLYVALKRGARQRWLKALSMTVMVSSITLILIAYAIGTGWVHALRTVTTVVYFVPIVLSGLYGRPWLSIYTALLAACQYLGLFAFATLTHRVNLIVMESFRQNAVSWDLPAVVAPILLLSGLLTAQLSRRMQTMLRQLLQSMASSLQLMEERLQALDDKEKADRALFAMVPELEEKKLKLEAMTDELHRQVAVRSRELSNVLALVDGPLSPGGNDLEIGSVFESRYTVLERLGSGGMGSVYEVQRLSDGIRFALKLVTGSVSGRSAARIAREAEIGARIRHPNLVSIVDVGISCGGAPFLVMNLERGGSLEQQRPRFGDPQWALPLLADVAAGLAALHAQGVAHRDLKPANILLSESDGASVARIGDYGIAAFEAIPTPLLSRMHAPPHVDKPTTTLEATLISGNDDDKSLIRISPAPSLTGSGVLVGTPRYMPPEGCTGVGSPLSAGDIFSFGLLAYEMVSGRFPFPLPPIFLSHSGHPLPPPPPLDVKAIDPRFAGMVNACLATAPAMRPSAQETLQTLTTILEDETKAGNGRKLSMPTLPRRQN